MKRPQQHITDSAGERQIREMFEPLGWTVNHLEHDYGIDLEVEIFRNHVSTGVMFKVQLKSSKATQYSAARDFLSQSIDTDNARYLSSELRVPILLIHADVENKRTFWLAPQLLVSQLQDSLRKNSSVTLRIPTVNELPTTINQLVRTVTQVEKVLASRLLLETPAPDFVISIQGHVDQEKLAQSLQDKSDAIRLEQAHDLFQARALDPALDKAEKIVNSPDSSIASKFAALLFSERIKLVEIFRAGATDWKILRLHLDISGRLQEISAKGPAHLKFVALITRKAAELESFVSKDFGLYQNWLLHQNNGDYIWQAHLVFERTRVYRQIVRKYNQCLRLARYAANSRHRWILAQALLRIVNAASPFIIRLNQEGLEKEADSYSASTLELCRLAAWLANEAGDDLSLSLAITTAPITKIALTGEAIDWARSATRGIRTEQIRKDTEERLDQQLKSVAGEKTEFFIETNERQIYETMANALGIDLSNEQDVMTKRVQIGIADSDPSRILKNCEHIAIYYTTQRMLAEVLGLPALNRKLIMCDIHLYAIEGSELDIAYRHFREKWCDHCPDSSPRPDTWQYTESWQHAENERHANLPHKLAKLYSVKDD